MDQGRRSGRGRQEVDSEGCRAEDRRQCRRQGRKAQVTMQQSGWEGEKPVYKTIAVEPPVDASKSSDIKVSNSVDKFSSMGEALIKIDAKVVRKDSQQVDGKAATLFVVDSSKGPMDMKMQVWVDPAS